MENIYVLVVWRGFKLYLFWFQKVLSVVQKVVFGVQALSFWFQEVLFVVQKVLIELQKVLFEPLNDGKRHGKRHPGPETPTIYATDNWEGHY